MSPFNVTHPARQAARPWSQRLGSLAAGSPAIPPQPFTQFAALPAGLAAIVGHLRKRIRPSEYAADKLRANEFMTGG
jgi:hypothetical protein